MKVLPFKVPKAVNSSFLIQVDDELHFYDILHKHPEFQLTVIIESDGTALIGDYVGNFKPGDVFLIASNVPHVFKNDNRFYEEENENRAYSVTIFFNDNLFGDKFFSLPETHFIGEFIKKHQSLKIDPQTAKLLRPRIEGIKEMDNLNKVIELLSILQILASSSEHQILTSELRNNYTESQAKRINDIYQFTLNEFQRDITLEEVAEISNMTVQSFCRYFKKRTRKTYIQFLTEMRISYACKKLQEEDLSITGICLLSGFNNLSNFNRKFKEVTGLTPSDYRKINHNL
ncbi:AraC family transcriptional regulator [Marinigracilibium pacificum]|uniref:Helix-turn-helix domain-containing protein n=1 Tax=Marinigracilibium pacificum TaxID=2729599 RepID=A0A848J7G7_9BACT|nr:AraC family transcriptional regulator [Marinigracilibium pacificum]NMM50374.1 helix-turn-helix domain-containing protein [Marinigracilibium pacificum]